MKTDFGRRGRSRTAASGHRLPAYAAALLAAALAPVPARAENVAAKNREGNRLFEQGRFGEAEQAYRAATGAEPGRPELLYNLGNSLLKQKEVDSALNELREAATRGASDLRARAWYNTGNALFESQRFKEAAEAYAQSLRIDPRDGDAKHNLELALRRQADQKKKPSDSQDQPNPEDRKQKEPGESGERPRQPQAAKQPPPDEKEQDKPADPRATSAEDAQGSFSKERALQILDALRNQELVEQRKLLEARARRKSKGRDW